MPNYPNTPVKHEPRHRSDACSVDAQPWQAACDCPENHRTGRMTFACPTHMPAVYASYGYAKHRADMDAVK